jgi:pyrophosphatase PpaX
MKKYNTVLFDLDGTLLDTNKLIIDSFHHAFDEIYKEIPSTDKLTSFFGMTLREAFRQMARDEKDVEILIEAFRDFNLSNHDDYVQIFPGVEDTIIRLKEKNFKIGVVTSKLNKTAKRGLSLFNLEKYIDVFIGADDTHIHKPDPFPVLECLKDWVLKNIFLYGRRQPT